MATEKIECVAATPLKNPDEVRHLSWTEILLNGDDGRPNTYRYSMEHLFENIYPHRVQWWCEDIRQWIPCPSIGLALRIQRKVTATCD